MRKFYTVIILLAYSFVSLFISHFLHVASIFTMVSFCLSIFSNISFTIAFLIIHFSLSSLIMSRFFFCIVSIALGFFFCLLYVLFFPLLGHLSYYYSFVFLYHLLLALFLLDYFLSLLSFPTSIIPNFFCTI